MTVSSEASMIGRFSDNAGRGKPIEALCQQKIVAGDRKSGPKSSRLRRRTRPHSRATSRSLAGGWLRQRARFHLPANPTTTMFVGLPLEGLAFPQYVEARLMNGAVARHRRPRADEHHVEVQATHPKS